MFRATPTRVALATALCLIATVAIVGGAAAKGTPSNITVTCDSNVTSATITVQLMSGTTNPTPASNQLVLGCTAGKGKITISPLSQPAAAYSWSAFVTGKTATFGCGGTASRGTTVTCTNDAGTSADGVVTILAS
jgi:hypothetical protein